MSRIVRISASQALPTNGGKVQIPLDFLPTGYRLDSAFIEVTAQVDVPAAGLTSDQASSLVSIIESERRLRLSGLGASALDWQRQGRDQHRPAALVQNNDQAVSWFWPVTWRDRRGVEATDASVATAFLKGKTLDVHVAKPTDILAGFAIDSGSVQLTCFLSPLPHGVVPASIVQGYAELIGKECRLPAGRYVDILILKNDGATISEAEIGNLMLVRDGRENILERIKTPSLARAYNYFAAEGSGIQGATDGVEGEALPDSGALPFVPVLFPVAPFKATKLPDADESMVLTIDGTLAANTARVFYRYIEEQDEMATAKAAVKLGIPLDAASTAVAKTVSKSGVSSAAPFKKTAGVMARRIQR